METPSAPSFVEYEDDDRALALEMQRVYEQQIEQLTLDEVVAYSLVLEEARLLHTEQVTSASTDSASASGSASSGCVCCLAELAVPAQRRVMPCGHVYCVRCIATRCRLGVRDRSLVPAHCCQKEFPSDYVKETLTPTDWATYERFVDERHWMRAGRHGLELVSDADYADAVARQGWRQCPQCGVGVEKVDGCNAIQCLRGHHFCWGCGTAPCQCAPGMATNLRAYGYRG